MPTTLLIQRYLHDGDALSTPGRDRDGYTLRASRGAQTVSPFTAGPHSGASPVRTSWCPNSAASCGRCAKHYERSVRLAQSISSKRLTCQRTDGAERDLHS